MPEGNTSRERSFSFLKMGEVTAKCIVGNDSLEEEVGAVKERGAERGQSEGPGG